MNHSEITELLGAYALDAIDDAERVAIEEHLAECGRCRAEVAEHRDVASLLAHQGGQAPEGVWERIAGSLEAPPPNLRLAPVPAPGPARQRGPRPRPWVALVGAAAAAALVVLGVQVVRQGDRIDELEASAGDSLSPALEAALGDPDSTVIELASSDGEVQLRGAITEDGTGFLRATALPELDPSRTYQLWGGAGDELISLGVLGADPGVVSFEAAGYDLLAITAEPSPGVVAPTSEPLVSGPTA